MQISHVDWNQELSNTLATCKQLLEKHYGTRLQFLILFGSVAKHQSSSESDLDLLAVLQPPFDYFHELYTLVDLLYPIQLEANHWISVKPASTSEFHAGKTQLYRNIKQEGIVL